jgi:lysophospholipase L1-like esterase
MIMIQLGLTETHDNLDQIVVGHPDTWYAEEFRWQQQRGTYPDGIFREVSAMEMLAANPPIYFERNLRSMVAIADAHHIAAVLATFAYSPLFTDFPRVASPEYQFALDEGNQVVREVAETTPVYLYDFAQEMPDDKQYYTDGRHFTPEGNVRRAEMFADFLIASDLLPDRSS